MTGMSMKAKKTIKGRDLTRGTFRLGESLMIEKKAGKHFGLKHADSRPKSIVAAVERIIEEVPIGGRRLKMDAVKVFLEDRK